MFAISLKVGDEVGFGRSGSWGSLHSTGFGKVTKINGYGHITVEGTSELRTPFQKVFDKYGNERGTNFGVKLIKAQYLRETLAATEARRSRNHRAKDLQAKLNGMFSYGGDFHVTDESKAELIALVNAL
jgi:hypothetical protein